MQGFQSNTHQTTASSQSDKKLIYADTSREISPKQARPFLACRVYVRFFYMLRSSNHFKFKTHQIPCRRLKRMCLGKSKIFKICQIFQPCWRFSCPRAYVWVGSTWSDKVAKVSTGILELISINEKTVGYVLKITMELPSGCQMTELMFLCSAMLALTLLWNGGADRPISEAVWITKETH